MSSIVVSGDTSGTCTLQAPAVAGSTVLTLPATSGTVSTLGTALTSGTAVASTSGTSIDFTGIPSWAKRITVMFNGVSTSSSSNLLLQIGNGSVIATGYDSAASSFNATNVGSTIGFVVTGGNLVTASIVSGSIVLTNFSSNLWVSAGVIANTTAPATNGAAHLSGGNKTLSGALDRVRITTANGTDTFDAGSINIMYE